MPVATIRSTVGSIVLVFLSLVIALAGAVLFAQQPQPPPNRARSRGDEKFPKGSAKPEEVGFSAERLQRINDVIQRHIDAKHISGAVTLVVRNGRVAHFEAHGLMDIESKKPMKKVSRFSMPDSETCVSFIKIAGVP